MRSLMSITSLFKTTFFIVVFSATNLAQTNPTTGTSVEVNSKLVLGVSGNADKPRIVRTDSGTLIISYGDSPPDAESVYDLKADEHRQARDVFVQTCTPSGARTCDRKEHWSPPLNLSNSARSSSITTRHQGALINRSPHPGDIDKANIRAFGPVVVASWVGKYCPDGDATAQGLQPVQQRAVAYPERDGRELPFSCLWLAYSLDQGATWSAPIQRSSGIRDAIQDSVIGGFNTTTRRGWFAQIWQEDPGGLLLGEAEGPGDGASGAQVGGGTDIWFGAVQFDLAGPVTLRPAVRLTDNWQGAYGRAISSPVVLDSDGMAVPGDRIELGSAGASRPTAASSGSTVILVYEQSRPRGSDADAAKGKVVRLHTFNYAKPVFDPADRASNHPSGCVISDPARNARRARVVAQSPEQAGPAGLVAAVFWREGKANQGGPADIMLRRLVGGTDPSHLDPPVDQACIAGGSSYASYRAENISANTSQASTAHLADDTELSPAENAIAHRALLRGEDLWLAYLYLSDLAQLATRQQAYQFWMRQYSPATGWSIARKLSRTDSPQINVREPRLISTPRSGSQCPSGEPLALSTTDPSDCQNRSAIWASWGTQSNEVPGSGIAPRDLAILVTHSLDAGANFSTPGKLSIEAGALEDEDATAFETQMVLRPDGRRFRSVWTQYSSTANRRDVVFVSGYLTNDMPLDTGTTSGNPPVPTPDVPTDASDVDQTSGTPSPFGMSSGGCAMSRVPVAVDPSLIVALGIALMMIWRRERKGLACSPRAANGW